MLSGDVSFSEALSSLNVGDLLKDFEEKNILRDLIPNTSVPTMDSTRIPSNNFEYELRSSLNHLTQKAEQCDRLLDAISLERARIEKKKSPPLSYEIESDISLASLAREIVSLKEGQTRITQILEMMQLEIRNKPNSSVNLPSQASSIPTITQPYPAMFSSVGGGSLTTSPTNLNGSDTFFPKSPTSVDSTGLSDPKYKELKKKLLMANLKILELQNRSQKLPSV